MDVMRAYTSWRMKTYRENKLCRFISANKSCYVLRSVETKKYKITKNSWGFWASHFQYSPLGFLFINNRTNAGPSSSSSFVRQGSPSKRFKDPASRRSFKKRTPLPLQGLFRRLFSGKRKERGVLKGRQNFDVRGNRSERRREPQTKDCSSAGLTPSPEVL